METRNISRVDWTKAVLDDSREMRWNRTRQPVVIINPTRRRIARVTQVQMPECVTAVLAKFDEAQALDRKFQVDLARRAYSEAEVMARKVGHLYLAAMISLERACTYNKPDTCIVACKEAADLCRRSRDSWTKHLWQVRAKGAYSRSILGPHDELLELIDANIEQFELRQGSEELRARRRYIEDQLLGEREFDRAEYYSQSLLKDVYRRFGGSHWWAGVVLTFLVRAQLNLEKYQEAVANSHLAERILNEWCVEEDSLLQPYLKEAVCLRNAALNPLP